MDIVVVGSINMDTVLMVDRLPGRGETVTAIRHFTSPGGKGANQAVAAARLGRSVAFVGCVGDDADGIELGESLRVAGVDTTALASTATPSGMAVITVGRAGANTIVVSPGANAEVKPSQVAAASDLIADAGAIMVQLEIPLETVRATLMAALGIKVLNPAPAAHLGAETLALVDVVVPNESELGTLLGAAPPTDAAEAIAMARQLGGRVVVTLGAKGAVYVDGQHQGHAPAPEVEAVDTTAGGDAFCAGLIDALIDGAALDAAVDWAVRVGSTTVTRPGAQASLPRRDEVMA